MSFRTEQRRQLVEYVWKRYSAQVVASENANRQISRVEEGFEPDTLTIGFARRFATYECANLLLADAERLKRMLLGHDRPVQLIVAGKVHPNDGNGIALVQQMNQFLSQPEICRRAILLEDYDMELAQHLVAGGDVWLNAPLQPNEACGTSGMKILVNGGLNLSVLDGWWDEAFDLNTTDSIRPGWVIGSSESGSLEDMNATDANSLYDLLEQQVIPEFYNHDDDGIPCRWVDRVKESMTRLTPQFGTQCQFAPKQYQ